MKKQVQAGYKDNTRYNKTFPANTRNLSHPRTRTSFLSNSFKRLFGDGGVINDLEVKHADTDEVRPIFETPLKCVARMNRTGSKRLERDPGFL